MAMRIGIELRQHVTITVDTDDVEEGYRLAEEAIQNDSPDLDFNEPEIDSINFLMWEDALDDHSDRLYEELRDAVLIAEAS